MKSGRVFLSLAVVALLLPLGYLVHAQLSNTLLLNVTTLNADGGPIQARIFVFAMMPEGPTKLVAEGTTGPDGKLQLTLSTTQIVEAWLNSGYGLRVRPFILVEALFTGEKDVWLAAESFTFDPHELRGPRTLAFKAEKDVGRTYVEATPEASYQPILVNYEDRWWWTRIVEVSVDQHTAATVDIQIDANKEFRSGLLITDSRTHRIRKLWGTEIETSEEGTLTLHVDRGGSACASMRARLVWEEWMIPHPVYGIIYEERFYYKDVDPASLSSSYHPAYPADVIEVREGRGVGKGHFFDTRYRAWWRTYMRYISGTRYGVYLPLNLAGLILGHTQAYEFVNSILPDINYIAHSRKTSVMQSVHVSVWGDRGHRVDIRQEKFGDARIETAYLHIRG